LVIAVSCILSMWPSHRIRWLLINLTIFSSLIMSSNHHFVEFSIIRFLSLGRYLLHVVILTDNMIAERPRTDCNRLGNIKKN
jgi:cellulose synthase/poly-beta-1,6-N-acetylglucosamine synthase-like glycosyltransferase